MNLLDPCPHAGCAATGEHYHVITMGVIDLRPLEIECSRGANSERCSVEGKSYTHCFLPPAKRPMGAPTPEPMFALSTVEALIRAAIADAREGLGPLPVEHWAEDDDFYWSDDYQDYDMPEDDMPEDDMPEDDSPVWDGEFLKRYYHGEVGSSLGRPS